VGRVHAENLQFGDRPDLVAGWRRKLSMALN
jgi:hypothetical protein